MPPPDASPPASAPHDVVVGVVERDGRFLVQPRAGDPELAGAWELPGGKIGRGEDPRAALAREIAEETGLTVRVGELLHAHCHRYADRRVALWAYRCEPVGGERPPRWARWVTAAEYRAMPMPEANPPIVDAIERVGG